MTAYVGLSLLEWSTWRRLHRMRRLDAAAFLVTAAGRPHHQRRRGRGDRLLALRPPPSRQQARPAPPPLRNRAARGGLVIALGTVTSAATREVSAPRRLDVLDHSPSYRDDQVRIYGPTRTPRGGKLGSRPGSRFSDLRGRRLTSGLGATRLWNTPLAGDGIEEERSQKNPGEDRDQPPAPGDAIRNQGGCFASSFASAGSD